MRDIPSGEVGHITATFFKTKKFNSNFCFGLGLRMNLAKKNALECRIDYFRQLDRTRIGIRHVGARNWQIRSDRVQLSVNYYFWLGK